MQFLQTYCLSPAAIPTNSSYVHRGVKGNDQLGEGELVCDISIGNISAALQLPDRDSLYPASSRGKISSLFAALHLTILCLSVSTKITVSSSQIQSVLARSPELIF